MKERPILFSSPMVRAILDGSKTQTRRVVKPRKNPDFGCNMSPGEIAGDEKSHWLCPYGQLGDRLWVRETWQYAGGNTGIWYAATDAQADEGNSPVTRWKPSIHMPRLASRITLEITGVRIDRLQQIRRGDAMSEGCPFPNIEHGVDPRKWYADLWESLNGPGSWDLNPWVWMVEFKRIEGGAA